MHTWHAYKHQHAPHQPQSAAPKSQTVQWQRNECLKKAFEDVFFEGSWLLSGSKKSLSRFTERNEWKQLFNKSDEREDYIEIKYPPSDCNPYYAVLLALVAAHRTCKLEKHETARKFFAIPDDKTGMYASDIPKPTRPYFKKRFLSGERIIINTLNEAEAGLGDKFEAALRLTPPGLEQAGKSASSSYHR